VLSTNSDTKDQRPKFQVLRPNSKKIKIMKTFDCPKCGGPVNYDQDVIGANLTAKCPYCGSSLSVPDEMRGRPAQVISHVSIDLRNTGAGKTITKVVLLVVLIPVIGVIVAMIAMGGFLVPLMSRAGKPTSTTRPAIGIPGVKGDDKNYGIAREVLRFGSEGIGHGMFKDARNIAVDSSGKIYVGEYIGGRVQVFDKDGKFITQWTVDAKMPLTAIAANRNGVVYVVQKGVITRRDGATGNVLGEIPYSEGWGFDDIAMAPDGGFVTSWYKNRDDIVRFDSQGQVVRTMRAAISSVTDDSELDTKVAIDGLGNVYALGSFNNAVLKFSPEGKFLTRFGDAGDQPGQFRAMSAIAVDGKGRIYVSDIKGVQVFDSNGRYLTVFNPGIASGMVFNDQNELFIASRKEVVKLKLNE
jgi:sugar lactone lactonase YvrE/DNA-directed RNA polymerase subunit RPC12/RpoP